MKIADFNFELPKQLIAQTPAHPRDSARLLVYNRQTGQITDTIFSNIEQFLVPNTTLVLNQAKVDKCRLHFANIEVFLLETVNDKTARAMVRPGRKFKLGTTIELTDKIKATVKSIDKAGLRTLEFNIALDDPIYDGFRLTPFPPYIKQDERLAEDYQTVYARNPGSKAAPTAGLHFTDKLLQEIKLKHPTVEVNLDVSLGTFAPIGDDQIRSKTLHTESYSISKSSAKILNQAKHLTAVGTTSARLLESNFNNKFTAIDHAKTNIFIQTAEDIKVTNSLITNFHLPSTSLLILVAALTGKDELLQIYQHAIAKKYRFYSFGDAMLVI